MGDQRAPAVGAGILKGAGGRRRKVGGEGLGAGLGAAVGAVAAERDRAGAVGRGAAGAHVADHTACGQSSEATHAPSCTGLSFPRHREHLRDGHRSPGCGVLREAARMHPGPMGVLQPRPHMHPESGTTPRRLPRVPAPRGTGTGGLLGCVLAGDTGTAPRKHPWEECGLGRQRRCNREVRAVTPASSSPVPLAQPCSQPHDPDGTPQPWD